MCDKKTIDKIESGEAMIVSKKSFQWGIGLLIGLMIFLLTQSVLFGVWKGGVDEKVHNIEVSGTALSKTNHAILLDIAHNQRVIMNALGLKWESLPK